MSRTTLAKGFAARIKVDDGTHYLGTWDTRDKARLARDRAVLHLGLDRRLFFASKARALGPASPEQLRALARQSLKRKTSSRFHNVWWNGRRQRWAALVRVDGRVEGLGIYEDEVDAARAVDQASRWLGRPAPNFPHVRLPARSPEEIRARVREARSGTKHICVYELPDASASRPWYAAIELPRKRTTFIGGYASADEAAIARDRATLHYGTGGPLAFPEEAAARGPADIQTLRREVFATRKATRSSHYRGVYWRRDREKWGVQIKVDKRVHSLGVFDDEVEAALAFDKAARRLLGAAARARLNFPDD